MDDNESHPKNASLPMDVILESDGTVKFCKFVHPQNALLSIAVTLDGIVTDVSASHFSNAWAPIDVTPDGIVIDNNELHPENAHSPIDVRLESDGIRIICKFSQL